jgi:thioester reductase-like protein
MLSPSNFEVLVTIFALNRLGYAIFFLSTRLGPEAYARLMGMADCFAVIAPESLKATVEDISTHRPGCRRIPILQRQNYRDCKAVEPFKRQDVDIAREGKKMAFILHSSGSTGFPKPIFLTNLQCLANFRKSFGMRAFLVSPLFHSHALMEFFRAFYTKATTYFGNYAFPITSQNLMAALSVAKPDYIAAVPYVLKLLAEKPEGIEMLAKAKIVIFGGSSCPEELGNRLVAQGVYLIGNYGATETGQIMTSFRPPGDDEWQYMRLHKPVADHTLMDEIAPGVFECVGLDGLPSKGPSNSKPPYSKTNPENSFRTADLFTRHPDPRKSNFYKYLSRLDDRITLVNGEKVLPIPIENRIREEALVREAAVFGFERSVPGALIFRSAEHGLEMTDEEYLQAVWPAVEAANMAAETFSRVPRDLVIVKGPEVMYPRTDKGTFIRAQLYQQFAEDIDPAYRRFESEGNKADGLQLDIPQLEDWLLNKFRNDLRIPLPDASTDIFSAGVDSLQTTRIWRAIKKELDLGGQALGQNVVFEKGTVKALAQHLYSLRTGDTTESEDEIQIMRGLIDKYSYFTHHFPTGVPQPVKDVVIVTGATGNLGAFIVADLLSRPSVSEVWALVRAPGPASAGARILASLSSRRIDLTDALLSKLHALPSDFSQPNLGLDPSDLERLLSSATCVIHSAWAVNFNLGVRSFEAQHIRGTYNLLNFCLRSKLPTPAKFFFCSSISTASGTPKPATIPERAIEDLNHAQAMGYGRSKLVTEHIVRNAMRSTGVHARVLRIGQLSGDKANAIWNDTEAVALMIRSALTTGALPAIEERVSWLPVDSCARVVCDLAMAEVNTAGEEADLVYHLVNPKTFSWRDDLLLALKQKTELGKFDVVSPQEWIERLAASEQNPERNPSIKLIDFWRNKYTKAVTPTQQTDNTPSRLSFETSRTIQDCPVLADERDPVSAGLVERYVDVWLKSWRRG